MKKITSQDVALHAGVSQSAVSLILNESDKVLFNDETRARVIAAAKELGYELPKRKKRIPASRTGILLLFTPTLNNPFYSELVQTVESYADACGYCVIVCNTLRKPELERYYLETILKTRIDGMIFTFLPSFPEIVESVAGSVLSQSAPDGKNRMIAEYLNRFLPLYRSLGSSLTNAEYRRRSFVLGRMVNVIASDGTTPARALDVDEKCRLIVEYADGRREALSSGEISVKLA